MTKAHDEAQYVVTIEKLGVTADGRVHAQVFAGVVSDTDLRTRGQAHLTAVLNNFPARPEDRQVARELTEDEAKFVLNWRLHAEGVDPNNCPQLTDNDVASRGLSS